MQHIYPMRGVNLLDAAKFRLASQVAPITLPQIQWLRSIGLEEPGTIDLTIGEIFQAIDRTIPQIDENSAIHQNTPATQNLYISVDIDITSTVSDDLAALDSATKYVIHVLDAPLSHEVEISTTLDQVPNIVSLHLDLQKPLPAGKAYTQEINNYLPGFDKLPEPFFKRNADGIELIGSRQQQGKTNSQIFIDIFDLLLPILQPPLGDVASKSLSLPSPLMPWQIEGIRFLLNTPHAMLADDMGLGKTIQSIVAMRFLVQRGEVTRSLVLCPKSILRNWEREINRWAPELRTKIIRGPKEMREADWAAPYHVYITTYETLRQDMQWHLAGMFDGIKFKDPARTDFDCIILDEAQKIKNRNTDLSRAVHQLHAPVRWALTGTPLENKFEDIYAIYYFLIPDRLRGQGSLSIAHFKQLIKPYFLRRKADELPEMPAIQHNNVWLELSAAQRSAYDRAEQDGIVSLNDQGDTVTVQHVIALITKLKQICNFSPLEKESVKLDYLHECLAEIIGQGEKALVFSQYPEKSLKHIASSLAMFKPAQYDGSMSEARRDATVTSFQETDDIKVLLLSVKAGGVGLTLTSANHVFHFDQWWNPAIASQAEARARRLGQKKSTVFVTSLLTERTIEERIYRLLVNKRDLFRFVVDDMSDGNLTQALTEDDLFSLFGLSKKRKSSVEE